MPARFAPALFGFILPGFMTFAVSGIAMPRNAGLVNGFFGIWVNGSSTTHFANDGFRCAGLQFIEEGRGAHGVTPTCRPLQIAPSIYGGQRAIVRDPDRASTSGRFVNMF